LPLYFPNEHGSQLLPNDVQDTALPATGFLLAAVEIVIEDDVSVAGGLQFMDSDAHPRDTAESIPDLSPRREEVKPICICRRARIGENSFILKGVTVGEGAIIGVNSVVVTDIPLYSVAMGNPARVVVKNASMRPVQTVRPRHLFRLN
jgi:acetyltransferase-like isoleucine patch superfamily enzyme